MIKSDKEMKNNSIHHSILSELAILSERKNMPFEGFEPQSKSKD